MKITDVIADIILTELERAHGTVQIQRNSLAQQVGCVPSQINYVITSRFTPEQGYYVESRRGGGGYILITRADSAKKHPLMHVLNSIGDTMDERTCRAHLVNLTYSGLLTDSQAQMILSATSEQALREVPQETRMRVRCSILKQMLLASMK